MEILINSLGLIYGSVLFLFTILLTKLKTGMEVRALLPTTQWLTPYFFLLFRCLLFHFLLVIANIIMHPSQHS